MDANPDPLSVLLDKKADTPNTDWSAKLRSLMLCLPALLLCPQMTGRSSGTVIPPPLVRGGQHVPSKHNNQIVMPPLVRGAQVSGGGGAFQLYLHLYLYTLVYEFHTLVLFYSCRD